MKFRFKKTFLILENIEFKSDNFLFNSTGILFKISFEEKLQES